MTTRKLYLRQQELEALKKALADAQDDLTQHCTAKPGNDNLGELEAWEEEGGTLKAVRDDAAGDFGNDEEAELAELDDIESSVGRGWQGGVTLIPERDFEDHAREMAVGCSDLPSGTFDKWPHNCIDWAKAATKIRCEYSEAAYQGNTYLCPLL